MRTPIVILLLAAAALAGCSGDSDGPTEGLTPTPTMATGGGGGDETNAVPVATMTASTAGGDVPLEVTFSLEGSDADDDPLTFTFDADGDGSSELEGDDLPTEYVHTYENGGSFAATLKVSDGVDSATVSILINTTAGVPESITYAGTVIVPDPWALALDGCLLDAGRRDAGGPAGITGQDHPITPDMWGWSYEFDVTGVIGEFWGPGPTLHGNGEGTVPDESDQIVVCINDVNAANVSYNVVFTP